MATLRKATVGDFIIHEGPAAMSREQATVVALGPLADGEPLIENGEADADYMSWREAGYPLDNLPTALLIGAIDAPVNEEGTVYTATLLCGFAVVNTEAIAATGEAPSDEAVYKAWASLYQRSAIIGAPAPDNRASLSWPGAFDDSGGGSGEVKTEYIVYSSDTEIDATHEGYEIRADGGGAEVITLGLPPGVISRRYRIVNARIGQTLLIMPTTGERIYGGAAGSSGGRRRRARMSICSDTARALQFDAFDRPETDDAIAGNAAPWNMRPKLTVPLGRRRSVEKPGTQRERESLRTALNRTEVNRRGRRQPLASRRFRPAIAAFIGVLFGGRQEDRTPDLRVANVAHAAAACAISL